jgi:hypothetical protein
MFNRDALMHCGLSRMVCSQQWGNAPNEFLSDKFYSDFFIVLGPVVRKVDRAIHPIAFFSTVVKMLEKL